LAAYTEDDGFHEIQLNGKQLVFLFMAATVVSVVIFLCGVLVGRGVSAERGDLAQTATEEVAPVHAANARVETPPTGVPSQTPPPAVDELSYFNRLEKPNPPVERLNKPAPEKPSRSAAASSERVDPPVAIESPPAVAAVRPAPAATVPPVTKQPAVAPDAAPAAPGFAVQVAALNVRSEADAMVRRLSSKGYAAYVLAASEGTPAVFRVRIGSFKTRREADAMADKLQKEEKIKPWVTR
jgi:cell division septation protein DedD